MTPERWQQIKHVLATALEKPSVERTAYLDQSCLGDAELRREVEHLLQNEQDVEPDFLDHGALAEVAAKLLPEDNPWIGRRVGNYQIVEQIGAGGMGEVYRAFRADDQYRKDVALKVIRAGHDSASVIARFWNERQILAGLDHPNIARLLDGGTTHGATPYLVMELIEGKPLEEYCDEQKLPTSERLKLFIQICSAVQYAHQRLIIHRDIKPTNILVTADGTPKLLDFGIAKVLESNPAILQDNTLTALRIMTPEYASPEQINGEQVTTSSDIYSLGVVLYRLLTGQSPYPANARTSRELAAAITQREPERPSGLIAHTSLPEEVSAARGCSAQKLQKQLGGDLDNILLMALRKEPIRRYASAEQFAADLNRHLEGNPVLARKDTAGYRISKFVGRHKIAVVASAAALLAILGGLVTAVYEARIARRQAEIAREQRLRAERRFNDVRKLANSLMFEVHDSIKDLPGATPARKIVVDRALEYFDSLSREASDDPALQGELAAAYDRVGDLQGYWGAANLGKFPEAIRSYQKALAIRESLAAANPADTGIQTALLQSYFRLAFALPDAGDSPEALRDLEKALPIAQKLAAESKDPNYQDWLAGVHWQMANILRRSADFPKALEEYRQSTSIREPVAANPSANPTLRTHLAGDYNGLGQALWRTGNIDEAVKVSQKAERLLLELTQSNPSDATLLEYLGETYLNLPPILRQRGDLAQSLAYGEKAQQVFQGLVSRDPTNWLAAANLGSTEIEIADTLVQLNRAREAMPHVHRAMNIFESREHKTLYDLTEQARSYSTAGIAYEMLASREPWPQRKEDLRKAVDWLQKSVDLWERDPRRGSPDLNGGHEGDRARQELAKCNSALQKL